MKRGGGNENQTFAYRLDGHSGVPLYRQLIDQVQAAIASGILNTGDRFPTVRQVAVDLTINPSTVSRRRWRFVGR
jgi:GntR family transcriptional regulator